MILAKIEAREPQDFAWSMKWSPSSLRGLSAFSEDKALLKVKIFGGRNVDEEFKNNTLIKQKASAWYARD